MAWLEKRGKFWKIATRTAGGKIKRVRAYADHKASKQMLARFELAEARGAEGLVDPFKEHRVSPITSHITDYLAELRTLARDDHYVYTVECRLKKLADECAWSLIGDVTANSFIAWRSQPIERPQVEKRFDGQTIGPVTLNKYLATLNAFMRWAVKRTRVESNPIRNVETIDATGDIRRERRSLTLEELVTLFAAIAAEHLAVYRFMLTTGLRRDEVEQLVWGDVRLSAVRPFIKLRAKTTKGKRADVLPLRMDIADELRGLRADAQDGARVFPSGVPTIEQHRAYLTAAGIAWLDEDGRRVDIHAMRKTFGSMLSLTGAMPFEAMQLMRHTELKLTMQSYTDPKIFELAGAVDRLPQLGGGPREREQEQRATGTHGAEGAQRVARETDQRRPLSSTVEISNSERNSGSEFDAGDSRSLSGSVGNRGQMRHVGLEPTAAPAENKPHDTKNADQPTPMRIAGSAAGSAPEVDQINLQFIVDAWPKLSPTVRNTIVAIVLGEEGKR